MSAAFSLLRDKLLVPHRLTLDTFVVDDGYQNPTSLWECSARWPDGFGPFSRTLEEHGSRLGLWLPLNGCGLDTDWGARQGFERSDHRKGYYCLAGKRYRDEIANAVTRLIADGNLAFLKHDFNFLRCSAAGHGHSATERHGLAANVDAQIEQLQFERKLKSDLLISVTSGVWPSPWWLMHADFLWMGGADYQEDWRTPCSSRRAAEMSYRDARLYRLLRIERAQIPASCLMTHGIIRGRYAGYDPDETLENWSDYVVMHFGRGTLLSELYLSPEWMPDDFWPILGKAARWAKLNEATLRHTAMFGGRPDRGEPYGFVHWSESKGIVCVRNPSPAPETLVLTLDERPRRLRRVDRWYPVVIYPYRQMLEPIGLDTSLTLSLPGEAVVLVELYAELPKSLAGLPARRFAIRGADESAALAIFAADLSPALRTRRRDDDQRKEWTGSFQVDTTGDRAAELIVVRTPAGGVEVEVAPNEPSSRRRFRGREHSDWDVVRVPLALSERRSLDVRAWLPPSPFWPERASATVLLRMMRRPVVDRTIRLAKESALADWPVAPREEILMDELVLLDEKSFDRRRSLGESLVWVVAIGVVPFVAADWLAMRFGPAARPFGRRLLRVGVLITLALLYAITPMGAALARALL